MRLFVALDIADEVRATLAAISAKLRPVSGSARWVRIEGMHVTLKFIGEVSAEKVEPIKTALATVPFSVPIQITFRGLSFFPNERHPRVLWTGIGSGDELATLASAVESALEPVGIAREQRNFSPHLTLARFNSPQDFASLHKAIAAAGPLEFGSSVAQKFHLFQSILKPGGAEYNRLATFGISGDDSK